MGCPTATTAVLGTSLALALSLAAAPGPAPRAETLPEPLALMQALDLAAEHPRVSASAEMRALLPRRQPLYLDCHHLAFTGKAIDPERNRPLEALIEPAAAQRLEVLARFLDVLLADLAFARYDEAMAVAYIQFDRASVRRELGQFSDLAVLELESTYQEILHERAASQVGQQFSRTLLAQALNRPDYLPRELVKPALPPLPEPLPEAAPLLEEALAQNGAVRGLMDDAGEPERRLITLELGQQLAELLMRLRALAAAERQVQTESAYRDLKLDESRTLYDQEVTADLGYSMSQQTMTRMRERRIAYCRALAWSEIQALTGKPVWPQGDDAQ
ncbi:MAG: hypothetical protein ACM3ST_13935 [Bdellovibrio bacteriovorus]